jgi:hypothetical protein
MSFGEQITRLIDTRDREWVNLPGESYEGEVSRASAPLSAFLKIGDTYISQLLDTVFDSEEKTLTADKAPTVDESYYRDLTEGLIKLIQAEYKSIRDRAFIRFEMLPKDARTALGRDIDRLISQKSESIRDRVGALKEKLDVRSPGPTPAAPADAHRVVMEPEALYVSIHAKIQKSMESEDRKFLETLDRVLDAIHDSPIDKKNKLFRLQNVEFLIDQYNAPGEQKNPGLINAALYYLASSANGETIWLQFGPVIVAYFNKFM